VIPSLIAALEVTTSTLAAPTGGLALVATLLAYAAKQYKEGRQQDVEGHKKRADEAEAREQGTEDELRRDVQDLKTQVEALRRELREAAIARDEEFRAEQARHAAEVREMRQAHASEVKGLERLLDQERRRTYLLRMSLADHNIPLPEGVDP
jgi:ABC-type phosphate transport system auxiliary subunit